VAYFIWNGIDSRTKNIGVKTLPARIKPKSRTELIQLVGRNGFFTQDDQTYDSFSLSFECWLKKNGDVYDVINWLKGSGTLIFSDDLNKQYDAVIINAIPLERVLKLWRNFVVQFEVQPIMKGTTLKTFTITSPTLTASPTIGGNFATAPIITLTGTGNFTITINGASIILTGVSTAIKIDNDLMNTTESNGTINANAKMQGNFLNLNSGANSVSIAVNSGSFTTMKVDYYEKWL
jgi:phage-related protein